VKYGCNSKVIFPRIIVSKIKSSFFGGAEKEAGKQQAAGFRASGAEFREQGEAIRESFQPFVEPGGQAFQETAALSGALGVGQEQQAIDRFIESPGQQFLRERAEKSLIRNQAATGGLGGGNIKKALQEQAIGIAAQQQQQRLSNLGVVSSTGFGALQQQAQARQFQTGGVSQALTGAAGSKAAGTVGCAAGFRSGVGQVVQGVAAFSDKTLKKDIKKIGASDSGINIYEFRYINDTNDILHQGVIAQELLETNPDAVTKNNGLYSVDYSLIDVEFKELENG